MTDRSIVRLATGLTLALAAGLCCSGPAQTASKPSLPYRCVPLGSPGRDWCQAVAVNEAGEVAGSSSTVAGAGMTFNRDERAFYWKDANGNNVSDPGEMVFLGSLGHNSVARSINNLGEVVGYSRTANGDYTTVRAMLWNGRANPPTMTDLNELLSPEDQAQWVLNNAAQIDDSRRILVQGVLRADGTGARTFFLDPTTVPATLTDLGSNLAASGMNGLQPPVVVGNPNSGPVLFDAATSTTTQLTAMSGAYNISDAREVVGQVRTPAGYRHPAYWKDANGSGTIDAGEPVVDLGVFNPSQFETNDGRARAINSSGLVVGNTAASKGTGGYSVWAAFRWQAGTSASSKQDLNSLASAPFKLRAAVDISNTGLIVGWGNAQSVIVSTSAVDQAYLLKPM